MAKFDIKFIDCLEDEAYIKANILENLEGYYTHVIQIKGVSDDGNFEIWLDKSTAIKFAKTLRTEINKITANEEVGYV